MRPLHEPKFIVIPAKAGIQRLKILNEINSWIPAFAGMTVKHQTKLLGVKVIK